MSIPSWLISDEIRISKDNLDRVFSELKSLPQYSTSNTFEDAYSTIDWFGSVVDDDFNYLYYSSTSNC